MTKMSIKAIVTQNTQDTQKGAYKSIARFT
jgi:hypothetical protein